MCKNIQRKIEESFENFFEKYGRFVARHPVKVISIAVFVNVGLGFGVLNLEFESGIEQYTPTDSTASINREQVKSLFSYNTSVNFYQQSLPGLGYFGSIIIERKDGGNILNQSLWAELENLYVYVNNTVSYDNNGNDFTYTDVCAKTFSMCNVEGGIIFSQPFLNDMLAGTITHPKYSYAGNDVFINRVIGGVKVQNGFIISATAIKLTFNVESERSSLSRIWELAFLHRIQTYTSNTLTLNYAYSDSLTVELSRNIRSGIKFFSITFTMIILFSSLSLMGGNCLTNRFNLALSGVLGIGLSILGSGGLVTLCGVKFVDIALAMPFLIMGIGVDDMFVLLSGLAGTNAEDNIETRIGKALRTSGTAITITSVTDIVAFCAGASSVFPSVRNFSWYTGCAILFCYANYLTFFTGGMTINERRISKNRHFMCCTVRTKSKDELLDEGASKMKIICCNGSPQRKREDTEAPLEKWVARLTNRLVRFKPIQVVIIIFFVTYLAFAIWGTTRFKEDLDIRDVVGPDSYYHHYYDTDQKKFSQSLTVSINIFQTIDYKENYTFYLIDSLVVNLQKDSHVKEDFLISWIHAYRTTPYYDNSSDSAFISGLQTFLSTREGNIFINDVTIDASAHSITASRLHILADTVTVSSEEAHMMLRIREIVDSSSVPAFAYSPAFIIFEQFVIIVSQTMQTLGICVAVVFVVTAIFMPFPFLIFLITLTVVMIMVGVIGFISFWGITLSAVTMIDIIMCVGFSVDFSTHICHAFVMASGKTSDRVAEAIDEAGGPIFNGAISTIVGVFVLAFSSAYIFVAFFKVMFLVMVFGIIHALFLLPVILYHTKPFCVQPNTTKRGKVSTTTKENIETKTNTLHHNGDLHDIDTGHVSITFRRNSDFQSETNPNFHDSDLSLHHTGQLSTHARENSEIKLETRASYHNSDVDLHSAEQVSTKPKENSGLKKETVPNFNNPVTRSTLHTSAQLP